MQQALRNPVEQKATRAERVWMQLAAEIVSGGVSGGSRLDEVEQAARLGVSRTPLRESLRQLAALGLVENRPHRGAVVSAGAGDNLFAVLAELEAAGASMAAENMSPTDRRALAQSVDPSEIAAFIRRNCGNSVLFGLLQTLWRPFADHEPPSSAIAELAAAVAAGDGKRASAAAKAYVEAFRDSYLGG